MPKKRKDKDKPEKKDETMNGTPVGFQDLCTTCNNPPVCDSTRAGRRPVHFCEQFDNHMPPKPVFRPKTQAKPTDTYNGKYKGICTNCDSRRHCMNSQAEGGIWHCEEYS